MQSRVDTIDREKALEEWNTEADRRRSASNAIFDELELFYPGFLQKMMELFDRGKRNAAEWQVHLRHAPPGAQTWFEMAQPYEGFWQKGLCRKFRSDQHFVGNGFGYKADGE